MKDLLLRARVVVGISDYVKTLHQKACSRAARLFFLIQPIRKNHSFGRVVVAVTVAVAVVKPPDAGA